MMFFRNDQMVGEGQFDNIGKKCILLFRKRSIVLQIKREQGFIASITLVREAHHS